MLNRQVFVSTLTLGIGFGVGLLPRRTGRDIFSGVFLHHWFSTFYISFTQFSRHWNWYYFDINICKWYDYITLLILFCHCPLINIFCSCLLFFFLVHSSFFHLLSLYNLSYLISINIYLSIIIYTLELPRKEREKKRKKYIKKEKDRQRKGGFCEWTDATAIYNNI